MKWNQFFGCAHVCRAPRHPDTSRTCWHTRVLWWSVSGSLAAPQIVCHQHFQLLWNDIPFKGRKTWPDADPASSTERSRQESLCCLPGEEEVRGSEYLPEKASQNIADRNLIHSRVIEELQWWRLKRNSDNLSSYSHGDGPEQLPQISCRWLTTMTMYTVIWINKNLQTTPITFIT